MIFCRIKLVGLALFSILSAGCVTVTSDQEAPNSLARPWGRDTISEVSALFARYEHIVLVRVQSHSWVKQRPPVQSTRHLQGTIVKTWKGSWQVSETMKIKTWLDGAEPSSEDVTGQKFVVLTNKKSDQEIGLDTGELIRFDNAMEPVMEPALKNP